MKYSLVIGRFQPFHEGHKKLIQTLLDEGKKVAVAIRDTERDDENPYGAEERAAMIEGVFPDREKVSVFFIPDVVEVVYGRTPGWTFREVKLDKAIEQISGTDIRLRRPIWITGNSGAGKTTLAYYLTKFMDCIILDGDEMRSSISEDAGFSLEDRLAHNIKVAKLADKLWKQGKQVVISVIAPTEEIRKAVTKTLNPIWIYIERTQEEREDYPYEIPTKYSFIINNDLDRTNLYTQAEDIVKRIQAYRHDFKT
jgi:cytidyltransferase-like protein